jgi:hypothetical protein
MPHMVLTGVILTNDMIHNLEDANIFRSMF